MGIGFRVHNKRFCNGVERLGTFGLDLGVSAGDLMTNLRVLSGLGSRV